MSTILIAEDEERISGFLERGLTANGFTTEVAETGDAALALHLAQQRVGQPLHERLAVAAALLVEELAQGRRLARAA